MDIKLSNEQENFIEKALSGSNILVDACIGSGKTLSIQQLCQLVPKDKTVLYLTYNKLLKIDAKSKIHEKNVTVTNYHGFAYKMLKNVNITCGKTDLIQMFNRELPPLPVYDILVIDEYQDIDTELSDMLNNIKTANPGIQLIAVGDMNQKIYDKTTLDVKRFIDSFLGDYIRLEFTKCFRLNKEHAAMLGRVWNKKIDGVNSSCEVVRMSISEAKEFISQQPLGDVLCLGSRTGKMADLLNELENEYHEKFNKKTVYASISDTDEGRAIEPKTNNAIFTTFDSSKGLERKICVLFDFDEHYWDIRLNQPQQSYEILRNIFCVAASRGKEKIIFVETKYSFLSETKLKTQKYLNNQLKIINFSNMFDFKYKENIEKCFSLLAVHKLPYFEESVIDIKTNDDLIDLSPCVGIFQEASFFNKYDIDKEIKLYSIIEKYRSLNLDSLDKMSVEEKILLLSSLQTRHERYRTQVSIPFVTDEQTKLLHNRLSTVFSQDDNSQVECCFDFDAVPDCPFVARGYADVVKDNIVYELKFVSELTHEHFLQCACYIVALNLSKGVLWNTRNNELFEVCIKDKDRFLLEVSKTVLKIKDTPKNPPPKKEKNPVLPIKQKPVSDFTTQKHFDYFAVIDTETNWSNIVMSIGLCIVKKANFEIVRKAYYIIPDEVAVGGMYESSLIINGCISPMECSRQSAIDNIKKVLSSFSVMEVFAYNASFDCSHLPEMSCYYWYDIMKIAAYKQFNNKLPPSDEYYKTGKLKRNYGVEPILRLLSGNENYFEKHNALLDALDETKIIKLLSVPFDTYYSNALIKSPLHESFSLKKDNKTSVQNKVFEEKQKGLIIETSYPEYHVTVSSSEAASQLGVSKSTIYNLIKNGHLRAEKIGNKYHISQDSINDYIEELERIRKRKVLVCYVLLAVFLSLIVALLFIISIYPLKSSFLLR